MMDIETALQLLRDLTAELESCHDVLEADPEDVGFVIDELGLQTGAVSEVVRLLGGQADG